MKTRQEIEERMDEVRENCGAYLYDMEVSNKSFYLGWAEALQWVLEGKKHDRRAHIG